MRSRQAHRLVTILIVTSGICVGSGASGETLGAAFIGPPESVFDTKTQSCEPTNIPDQRAVAFRDANNQVHLFASHSVVRAMVGPNLNQLTRRCNVVYRSPIDPDPADFDQYDWPGGFFTADGRNVAALVHSEFHGDDVPGMCSAPKDRLFDCLWGAVTYAVSHDGGNSFTVPRPPGNLVASLPYQFAPNPQRGPAGYHSPTAIVQLGAFQYALINIWKYRDQAYGACLIRTSNPFDPQSWRAWDGSGFNVQFIDPYVVANAIPAEHVCKPVLNVPEVDSLAYLPSAKLFVATQLTHDKRFGPLGVYLNTSPDLIHWTRPVALVDLDTMVAAEGAGRWDYRYASLLDPASTDRDFVDLTDRPYLYYVRLDRMHPPLVRTLLRRQIRLTITN